MEKSSRSTSCRSLKLAAFAALLSLGPAALVIWDSAALAAPAPRAASRVSIRGRAIHRVRPGAMPHPHAMIRPRQMQHSYKGPMSLRPLAPGGSSIWRARRSLTPSRGPQQRPTPIQRAQQAPTLHNLAHFTEPSQQRPPGVLRHMGSFGLTGLLPAVETHAPTSPAVYDRAPAPVAQPQAAPKAMSQGIPVPQQFPSAGVYGSSAQAASGAVPSAGGTGYSSRAY